jgi:plasmid stability protein
MANLQVRDIDSRLYDALKRKAEQEHRSISQEVLIIIENHINKGNFNVENQTSEFLKLSNSWIDNRSAEEIAMDIKRNRSKNSRIGKVDELFD